MTIARAEIIRENPEVEAAANNVFAKILNWGCRDGVFTISSTVLVANTITTMAEMWAVKRFIYKKKVHA